MSAETETLLYTRIDSPIGELLLVGDGERLHGLHMQEGRRPLAVGSGWQPAEAPFEEARAQLAEYFAGERTEFDLPTDGVGTPFQRSVWAELERIPYGETISYAELARRIGRPSASRAVGMANGRNPISIIVPCHRVVGADGSLTGYGGGVGRKRFLLELESARARGKAYTLIGADGRPYESPTPGALGGHRRNKVYGRLDCQGAARWIAKGHYVEQRVFFADEATAIAAGYRPCAGCMPERYREWKAAA
jgi:methylated-DNA-[protein]-cysteine S-methyltransferase